MNNTQGRFFQKHITIFVFTLVLSTVGLVPQVTRAESSQGDISDKVRKALVTLPRFSVFDNLEFELEGDRVTLYGQVVRPVLADDAAAAVKRVKGVKEVVNKIETLPLNRNDDGIRRAAFRAVYGSAPLDRYRIQAVPPIHIIVKSGHITLTGVVATKMESDLAQARANQVPFVFSVTNKLFVEATAK